MGPNVHALSWTLSEADGQPVPNVRLADDTDAAASGYEGYLAGVGILIPPPLRAMTAYDLAVLWEGTSGMTATQALSLRPAPRPTGCGCISEAAMPTPKARLEAVF
jgi:hypothetical protein